MLNIVGIETLQVYCSMVRERTFPSIEKQKYKNLGDFSYSWNEFVYNESARAADQIGYGESPLAFYNDVLYC